LNSLPGIEQVNSKNALFNTINQTLQDAKANVKKAVYMLPDPASFENSIEAISGFDQLNTIKESVKSLPNAEELTADLLNISQVVKDPELISIIEGLPQSEILLDQLNNIQSKEVIAQIKILLADHTLFAELESKLDQVIDSKSIAALQSAIKALPDKSKLVNRINTHDLDIINQIENVNQTLQILNSKADIVNSFDALPDYSAAIDEINTILASLSQKGELISHLSSFPDLEPIKQSTEHLSRMPDKNELTALLEKSVSLTQIRQTQDGLDTLAKETADIKALIPSMKPVENQDMENLSKQVLNLNQQLAEIKNELEISPAFSWDSAESVEKTLQHIATEIETGTLFKNSSMKLVSSLLVGYFILLMLTLTFLVYKGFKNSEENDGSDDETGEDHGDNRFDPRLFFQTARASCSID